MKNTGPVFIGRGHHLTLSECNDIARSGRVVRIHPSAYPAMNKSFKVLSEFADNHIPIYGLSTQFGNQSNYIFDPPHQNGTKDQYLHSIDQRQHNLVMTHDCGLGDELPEEVARLTMALRAHCLALGHSGVRPLVAETLVRFLNKKAHPVIRRYGSIGASGDLIPLSAIAATLIGEHKEVVYQGKKVEAKKALRLARVKPLALFGREGLALVNGTSFSAGMASLALYDLDILFSNMMSVIAFSLESLMIMDSGYEPVVHQLKNHSGEIFINKYLRAVWEGSKLIQSITVRRSAALQTKSKDIIKLNQPLQDYYSLRSVSQGFGPFWENLQKGKIWIEEEMNSVNDNPIVDTGARKIHHAANFMGYYVTEACDILKMDIAQASTWLHAIFANMIHSRKNFNLPANLIHKPGTYNGFRSLQILAASLTVQNRKLAQANQSYMLPTEGDNQDVNSLSAHAAFDFREAVKNLERLTAILFLASMQAIEIRGVGKASRRAKNAHKLLRKKSSFIDIDRSLIKDIEIALSLLKTSIL